MLFYSVAGGEVYAVRWNGTSWGTPAAWSNSLIRGDGPGGGVLAGLAGRRDGEGLGAQARRVDLRLRRRRRADGGHLVGAARGDVGGADVRPVVQRAGDGAAGGRPSG